LSNPILHNVCMSDERQFPLLQIDQPRGDLYALSDDLDEFRNTRDTLTRALVRPMSAGRFRSSFESDAKRQQFGERSISEVRLRPLAETCRHPLEFRLDSAPRPGAVTRFARRDRVISRP
jgi:hypothetical protein